MSAELVKQLIDAGIHFGHHASKWNPKMKPYIFGKRNLIHIINVKETLKGILLAKTFLTQVVASGKDVLFVGTKRQARKAIAENAAGAKMHWVVDRWLGGTMTNFREIRKRIGRLDHLEQLEADGLLDAYSKKEGASLRREMKKIRRNLGGVRLMEKLPGALVLIDQKRETIAVLEARKMGIPVVCLLDTDSDPDMVDIPIPGNDDAMRAIELITQELCKAIAEGMGLRQARAAEEAEEQLAQRKRSGRPTTARAYEAPQPTEAGESGEAAPAEPAEPAEPIEPPQPAQPQPTEPAQPVEPAPPQPTESAQPVEPAEPVEPAQPKDA